MSHSSKTKKEQNFGRKNNIIINNLQTFKEQIFCFQFFEPNCVYDKDDIVKHITKSRACYQQFPRQIQDNYERQIEDYYERQIEYYYERQIEDYYERQIDKMIDNYKRYIDRIIDK